MRFVVVAGRGRRRLSVSVLRYFGLHRLSLSLLVMAPKRKADSSDGSANKKRKAITMEVKVDIIKRSQKGEIFFSHPPHVPTYAEIRVTTHVRNGSTS